MGKIPDRWLPYSPVGQPIEGTKFIAFKVPLKESICRNMKPDERFTPSMLVEQYPSLSLVVDLTNTNRYYNPGEFLSKGILYEKIFCPGKVIPSDDIVQRFMDIVDEYIGNCDSKESLIGVHCTHGLNRTGYFICTYMIKRLKIPAQEAISSFERARGYPIEREEYIQALIDGSNGESSIPKPQTKLESPLDTLYPERPFVNKYPVSRQTYQSRLQRRHDQTPAWNPAPNAAPYMRQNFKQRYRNRFEHNQVAGNYNNDVYVPGNYSKQRGFVGNNHRYGNQFEHNRVVGNEHNNSYVPGNRFKQRQFVGNDHRFVKQFEHGYRNPYNPSFDKTSEYQNRELITKHERKRSRFEPCNSDDYVPTPKNELQENPVGECFTTSSGSQNQSPCTTHKTDSYQQNPSQSRKRKLSHGFEADPQNAGNDFKRR